MSLDAHMLGAWESARDTHGHSVTVKTAAATTYSVATGANTDAITSTTVTGIVCPMSRAQGPVVDRAGMTFDVSVQVLISDLPRTPEVGDVVAYGGVDYEVAHVTTYTFGVADCFLRGVV